MCKLYSKFCTLFSINFLGYFNSYLDRIDYIFKIWQYLKKKMHSKDKISCVNKFDSENQKQIFQFGFSVNNADFTY